MTRDGSQSMCVSSEFCLTLSDFFRHRFYNFFIFHFLQRLTERACFVAAVTQRAKRVIRG